MTVTHKQRMQASVSSLHILKDLDLGSIRSNKANTQPLPFGPFTLTEHKPTQSFALVPNEAFTGKESERAKLKRVQFKIVPEYQTRLLLLKKGEIDLMDGIQIKDADELVKNNPNIKLVRRGYRF